MRALFLAIHPWMLPVLIIFGTVFRFLLPFWRNPMNRLFSDPFRLWLNGQHLFMPGLMGGSDPIAYQVFIWLVRHATHENVFFVALVAGFWLSVLIWALACLTKPTVVPLAGVCLLWTWAKAPQKLPAAMGAAVLVLFLMIPSTMRSWQVLGFPAPLGNPWITKIQHRSGANKIEIQAGDSRWWFVSPSCNMFPLAPLSTWKMQRAQTESRVFVKVDRAFGVRDWREAYEGLNTGFREWMTQWGENILLFLFAPSWPDCNMSEWDGWLCVHLRWIWAPIIFFVLDCNIRDVLRRKFGLLAVATTVFTLFLMFQNVATSEGRYRKPLEPLLIMNLVWVWPSRKNDVGKEKELQNSY